MRYILKGRKTKGCMGKDEGINMGKDERIYVYMEMGKEYIWRRERKRGKVDRHFPMDHSPCPLYHHLFVSIIPHIPYSASQQPVSDRYAVGTHP